MLQTQIAGIETYLPEQVLTNEDLAQKFPQWSADQITAKTGISCRHISAEDETSTDMAVKAAEKLLAREICPRDDVDFVLLCTQTPDYLLPTSACLVHDRLGLSTSAGALDFNLGCSGFVYGLSLASGLVEAGSARNVLLITSETYSKLLDPDDGSTRCLFGDGAAAALVRAVEVDEGCVASVGPFVFGTDGSGAESLMMRKGGMRAACDGTQTDAETPSCLQMNGPAILSFTMKRVPAMVSGLLESSGLTVDDIDWFVLHQANAFMLNALRKQMRLPKEKFVIEMGEVGNTVSSTIPLALRTMSDKGTLTDGCRVMLVAFGVGLSWSACLVTLPARL